MSSQKRKRTDFTLKEKKEIIFFPSTKSQFACAFEMQNDAAKKEPNQSKLAREMSKKWEFSARRMQSRRLSELEFHQNARS